MELSDEMVTVAIPGEYFDQRQWSTGLARYCARQIIKERGVSIVGDGLVVKQVKGWSDEDFNGYLVAYATE